MNMTILTLIITVLSLVFIVMSYYGIVRLCKLKMGSCDSFAKDYVKLSKADSKSKIIVSLYGTSIEKLKPTINSIFDQTVRPDQIIISVPEGTNIHLDPYVTDNNLITIHTLSKDYKTCCNLVSPLLREKVGDTIIILANENTVYGADFIESIVDESEKHPNCVIFVSKYNAKIYSTRNKKIDNGSDVIDTSMGVLIKPQFFPPDILDENKFIEDLDVMLSVQMHKYSICAIQLEYSEIFSDHTFDINRKNNIDLHAVYFPSFA